MAKPQLENGHTRIANEILETLARISLAPNQWQVLLVIIRKTYGFHKKVDYIANFQIGEATGLCKAVVSRCLKELWDRQLITRKGKFIGFQKDWEKWKGLTFQTQLGVKLAERLTPDLSQKLAKQSTKVSNSAEELAKLSTKVSSPRVAQKIKDTTTKDTIQKKPYGEFKNVFLSDKEYQKLKDRFGSNISGMIENLSIGIESKGYKYKSHYATILSWDRMPGKGGKGGTHRGNSRQLAKRRTYTDPSSVGE